MEKDVIRCPYCGSVHYDTFDNMTFNNQNIDYHVCEMCEHEFKSVYVFDHVEEVD